MTDYMCNISTVPLIFIVSVHCMYYVLQVTLTSTTTVRVFVTVLGFCSSCLEYQHFYRETFRVCVFALSFMDFVLLSS